MRIAEIFPISEARRNPHLNVSLSPYETLLKYQGKPNMFVSFTAIDKLGINPRTEYATPVGVYAYPLDYVIYGAKLEGGDIFRSVPFAATAKYMNIFQASGNIIKFKSYRNGKSDLEKIRHWYEKQPYQPKPFQHFVDNLTSYHNNADFIWKLVYTILYAFNDSPRSLAINSRMIFNKILGWDSAVDDTNEGIIHGNEPTQAVFFNTRSIKLTERVMNAPAISGGNQVDRALQAE